MREVIFLIVVPLLVISGCSFPVILHEQGYIECYTVTRKIYKPSMVTPLALEPENSEEGGEKTTLYLDRVEKESGTKAVVPQKE